MCVWERERISSLLQVHMVKAKCLSLGYDTETLKNNLVSGKLAVFVTALYTVLYRWQCSDVHVLFVVSCCCLDLSRQLFEVTVIAEIISRSTFTVQCLYVTDSYIIKLADTQHPLFSEYTLLAFGQRYVKPRTRQKKKKKKKNFYHLSHTASSCSCEIMGWCQTCLTCMPNVLFIIYRLYAHSHLEAVQWNQSDLVKSTS